MGERGQGEVGERSGREREMKWRGGKGAERVEGDGQVSGEGHGGME